jgi:uncharacterized protein (DUF1800 family)
MVNYRSISTGIAATLLTACGGGETSTSSDGKTSGSSEHIVATEAEASRFLGQATFGANKDEITALVGTSLEDWLNAQFAEEQTSHLAAVANVITSGARSYNHPNDFFASWWGQAARASDQLRQRVAFALSQIMVVSFDLQALSEQTQAIAYYYDILGKNAFGNFRTLLEDVTLTPAMGIWLSHLKNQKEDASKGRTADENYAREVMQLFTIGLHELNQNGTARTVNGDEIDTFSNDDVTGLAKVFTGFSWGGPDTSDNRFFARNGVVAANRYTIPMQAYAKYHSTSTKSFLGVTTNGTAEEDLKVALDTLYNHANVGPFIGKQLIQKLVTSNPSAAYVSRVSAAFADNGSGVRGDLKAVLRAILLDDEARDIGTTYSAQSSFGRIRDPIQRMANWMRAFNVDAQTGWFYFGTTDSPSSQLGMTPMRSPSVFNFYRPGYVAPNSYTGAQNLTAPELQITHETSVAGYLNYMRNVVNNSMGNNGNKIVADYSPEVAMADAPETLVDHVILVLNAGVMPSDKRSLIVNAVNAISISNSSTAETAKLNRVKLAAYLVLASVDYIAQK